MNPAEKNYNIYDKELLSIVLAFQNWRVYLEVRVISDHKNLEQFLFTKHLHRSQTRWSEMLSAFNLAIHHRPSSLNGSKCIISMRRCHGWDR